MTKVVSNIKNRRKEMLFLVLLLLITSTFREFQYEILKLLRSK